MNRVLNLLIVEPGTEDGSVSNILIAVTRDQATKGFDVDSMTIVSDLTVAAYFRNKMAQEEAAVVEPPAAPEVI